MNESSKSAKKATKAKAKLQKKLAKAGKRPLADAHRDVEADSSADRSPRADSPTPAERSAAAAERQVALQRYRVWIALLVALLALASLLATVKPWTLLSRSSLTEDRVRYSNDQRP